MLLEADYLLSSIAALCIPLSLGTLDACLIVLLRETWSDVLCAVVDWQLGLLSTSTIVCSVADDQCSRPS